MTIKKAALSELPCKKIDEENLGKVGLLAEVTFPIAIVKEFTREKESKCVSYQIEVTHSSPLVKKFTEEV